MEVSIILLSVISGFAIVLSVLSYISLQKLRTNLKTAQKEMIDLRNHVNLSIKELSKKIADTELRLDAVNSLKKEVTGISQKEE